MEYKKGFTLIELLVVVTIDLIKIELTVIQDGELVQMIIKQQ